MRSYEPSKEAAPHVVWHAGKSEYQPCNRIATAGTTAARAGVRRTNTYTAAAIPTHANLGMWTTPIHQFRQTSIFNKSGSRITTAAVTVKIAVTMTHGSRTFATTHTKPNDCRDNK